MLHHLLLLTSAQPDFFHSDASRTVTALIAEEFAKQIGEVTIGVCCATKEPSQPTLDRLAKAGVRVVTLPSVRVASPQAVGKLGALKFVAGSLLSGADTCDYPRPDDVETLARAIDAIGADAALLFWDTLAEFALPTMKTPSFGYTARPPFAAAVARTEAGSKGWRKLLNLALYARSERRHIERLRCLKASANICALDAAYYNSHGVPCGYVSNTWPDVVGTDWAEKRAQLVAARSDVQILGNIGGLGATGNAFGMHYLGAEILPLLAARPLAVDWSISICGPGRLAADTAMLLDHSRVCIKGFVDDVDAELLSSPIFLLLNNAGPYSGGYTRVIYAFSTGACLIAHTNLKASMPELVSGENCLLADSPSGLVDHIERALTDAALRRRIGQQARLTYDTQFAPVHVARKLIAMIETNVAARAA